LGQRIDATGCLRKQGAKKKNVGGELGEHHFSCGQPSLKDGGRKKFRRSILVIRNSLEEIRGGKQPISSPKEKGAGEAIPMSYKAVGKEKDIYPA